MEAALLATNLVIAIVYAWILVVMVQQRKVMSQQLAKMQSTRLAAHRPVLAVREEPEGTFITNIGHGPALDGMIVMRLGELSISWLLLPLGVGEQFAVTVLFKPREMGEWLITYRDMFGNEHMTHYFWRERRHVFSG
jgi:hypothetical protein